MVELDMARMALAGLAVWRAHRVHSRVVGNTLPAASSAQVKTHQRRSMARPIGDGALAIATAAKCVIAAEQTQRHAHDLEHLSTKTIASAGLRHMVIRALPGGLAA